MARPCCGALQATPQMSPLAGAPVDVTSIFGSPPAAHLTSRPSSTTPFVISIQCPALPPTTPGSMYTFTATARPPLPLPSTSRTNDENEAADEREVLELSRDFESLTAKDEKGVASDAGQDTNPLEDLPAQLLAQN
ncbi:hypothetical protein PVAP13_8KG164701 [Panicum virgatum]|uniref:Uncharacterized protein n=1 Tax=Panicum virgatum TaxID=38727 RepID=A0A8T0PH88_PANVG|nr:hypothetical protein PVAP13_8KG164701 [Panicum virgatum]